MINVQAGLDIENHMFTCVEEIKNRKQYYYPATPDIIHIESDVCQNAVRALRFPQMTANSSVYYLIDVSEASKL